MFSSISLLQLAIFALTASAAPLERRQSLSTTRNELISGSCQGITILFARGTTEAGNVGSLVGPYFCNAVALAESSVACQGVDYPADVAGYLAGGSTAGASTLASLVRTARSKCPNTKIILSGYSQGAQVVHLAAGQLSTTEASSVAGIVLFGDPYNGDAFPGTLNNHVKTFCNVGDLICLGQPIILTPHLTYNLDAAEAAEFVSSIV